MVDPKLDPKLMAAIEKLDIDERTLLAHTIWDGIRAEMEASPVSRSVMAELKRRIDKYGDSMKDTIPWEEVERELIRAERDETPPRRVSRRGQNGSKGNSCVVPKAAKRARRRVSR